MSIPDKTSRGLFIVFEGGEGTGKTTQIRRLEKRLQDEGHAVLVTWEPGGTPLGEKIRALLLEIGSGPAMGARCEALLYAAARSEHVEKVIRPALMRGSIVLCDRYWDASRAYQGSARGLGFKPIDSINDWGTQGLRPDFAFYFDLDASLGLARAAARTGGKLDRLESEGNQFHNKVRDAYLEIVSREPSKYESVDARGSVDEISEQIWKQVKNLTPQASLKP